MKTLLVYATAHGSTAEIARYITNILKECGVTIDLANVKDIETLQGYDAYIFGTAIHNGAWLQELTLMLRKDGKNLKSSPVYLFMTCMRVLEQYGSDHVNEFYVNPDIIHSLNIRNTTAFAGKLDLSSIDWNERWTLAARYDGTTWPSSFDGDYRDWSKIHRWANLIAEDLQKVEKALSSQPMTS